MFKHFMSALAKLLSNKSLIWISSWPYLLILLLLSIIATSIIIERSFYFYKIRLHNKRGIDLILIKLRQKDLKALLNLIQEELSPESIILRRCFRFIRDKTRKSDQIKIFIRGAILEQITNLEKKINYLSTIASIATLIGLLGTVLGMINTFTQGVRTSFANSLALAGGISQALVSTAGGLILAILAMLAYHILTSIVQNKINNMNIINKELMVYLYDISSSP